ncbi:glutathione S-transferase family protein [Neptuniibacter halophilus]|uniref:glutathione S-transferase family protein n=1 Tax=Neptuniibacter halophilus TaxID=651666 RepID=UPI0025748082|nr:glutathione S-transferase C-terminal domain-containing protein [Neptuniibacter halophilus]
MLMNGQWSAKWDPVQQKDERGRFIRQSSAFTGGLSAEEVESGRYRLCVAYICPWACRTLIARSLLGLEAHIPLSVVEPVLTDSGWRFASEQGAEYPGATGSGITGVEYMHQLYTATEPAYTGRATVPVLWDQREGRIVNNESADILRLLNEAFRPLHGGDLNLCPDALKPEIDQFNERIYQRFNNGVYRAGFASSQQAYAEALDDVFTTLNWLETHFRQQAFAVGDQLTESDIRLFVTLVRFDPAYYGLFKTNLHQIGNYPSVSAYLERLLQIPAFAKNTRIDHIKAGYYSIKALNPNGIVPAGPQLPWFRWLQEGV